MNVWIVEFKYKNFDEQFVTEKMKFYSMERALEFYHGVRWSVSKICHNTAWAVRLRKADCLISDKFFDFLDIKEGRYDQTKDSPQKERIQPGEDRAAGGYPGQDAGSL